MRDFEALLVISENIAQQKELAQKNFGFDLSPYIDYIARAVAEKAVSMAESGQHDFAAIPEGPASSEVTDPETAIEEKNV